MRTSTSLGAAILMSALGAFAVSAVSTSASPLARDGKIVFEHGDARLFIVNSDGTGAAPLRVLSRVQRDTGWFQPSWSPDGKRLALIGYFDNGTMDGDTRIYVRNPDGRAKVVTRLGATDTSDVSWSPNGEQIVSDSGSDFPNLFIVRVATGKWHQVGNVTYGDNPSWSPDGAWICYQSRVDEEVKGIALVKPNGQGKVLLTTSGNHPDWSPGGKRIVFDDRRGIFVVDLDGSHLKQLTTRAGDSQPDWSPTGSRILFTRDGPGSRTDLWVMHPDGRHQVRLIKNGEDPDWQPLR